MPGSNDDRACLQSLALTRAIVGGAMAGAGDAVAAGLKSPDARGLTGQGVYFINGLIETHDF